MTTDFGITSIDNTLSRSTETISKELPKSLQPIVGSRLEILAELNPKVGRYAPLDILTDPRFEQLSPNDKKTLLYRIKLALKEPDRLCDMLPPDFDRELVDVVDGWYLPSNQPSSNLAGKHLVKHYQELTAKLTENQKRLYAHELIRQYAFQELLLEEKKAVLANLKLSPENYALVKKNLPESQQREMGPLLDALMGNNLAIVPYTQTPVQAKSREPMTQENWADELQNNSQVLIETKRLSLVGTKEELITLRDAKAIVRVFPNQTFFISGYTITREALEYIQENAPKIEFGAVHVEDKAAPNSDTMPLESDLEHKWSKAAINVIYQAKNQQSATSHQLPLIDIEDATAIVEAKIPPIIRGYAITYDALQIFQQNHVEIDIRSNLIVSNLMQSDFNQPIHWAEIIQDRTTISAPQTDFDKLSGLETLKQALEPANTLMVFAQTNEIVNLDSAEFLASTVNNDTTLKSQTIKLIRYTLTKEAAQYLQTNAPNVDIKNSSISTSKDPTVVRDDYLLEKWVDKVSKALSVIDTGAWNFIWKHDSTPIGWELMGDSTEIITLNNAKAIVKALKEYDSIKTIKSIKLVDYWLTKEAAEYLKGFPVIKFNDNQIVEDVDPAFKNGQALSQKWTQALTNKAVPVSQFRKDNEGSFPVIDADEVQHLRETCQTLDVSDQMQIAGYAITEGALLGLLSHFPKMELYLHNNVIVTNTIPSGMDFPNFGNLLASSVLLEGSLATVAGQNKRPIIDDENVEALISALQQKYPNQRVVMPGYTVTEDIEKRLERFVDLRFCHIIPAAPKIYSPNELALVPVGSQEIALAEKSGALVTKRELTLEQRERNWTMQLQNNTDVMTGSYLVLPFSKDDKVIELEDAKMILQVCEKVTGPISAIRGHTITQEAYQYLTTKAPHIDLKLNRIAPQADSLILCEKIGTALAKVLGAVIVLAAIVGVFMLIGEVAFIILVAISIGAFLVLIGELALGVTTPLRWAVKMLPTWLYMLELYARSLGPVKDPMKESIDELASPARSWLGQKLQSLWTPQTPSSQALIPV